MTLNITTFSTMTLNITTFSIMSLIIKGCYVTLGITMLCHYTECRIIFIIMLGVIIIFGKRKTIEFTKWQRLEIVRWIDIPSSSSLCLFLHFSFLSLFPPLSLSLSLSLYFFFYFFISKFVFLLLHLSISLSPSLHFSFSISPFLFLLLSISLCLSPYISLSLFFPVSFSSSKLSIISTSHQKGSLHIRQNHPISHSSEIYNIKFFGGMQL